MKRLLPLLIFLFVPSAMAQQGTIAYEEVVKIELNLPPEMESMRDQIPDSRMMPKLLLFSESESLMMDAPEAEGENNEITLGGDGMQIRMRMANQEADNRVYTNLDDGVVIDKRDFMGRTFLITGDQPTYAWRLTGEQSEYLGFACQKAVAEQDSTMIEAWFTTEIPYSIGPDVYGGLPGAILVLTLDDGQRTFTATNVDMEGDAIAALEPPDDGRKVTRQEFDEIVEEKMKEMGMTQGRGGAARMIIRH
jgi:GLPGLI family protein